MAPQQLLRRLLLRRVSTPFRLLHHRRDHHHQLQHAGLAPSVPVLIVGAGPVGLVLSILLAKLGIRSLVIEKKSTFSQHPQAHFINNRTMEIFRKLNALSEDIEALQPPVDQWRKFVYCTSLSGPLLGMVDHLRPQDLARKISPTWVAHFSQHRLLPLLLQQAERCGLQVKQGTKHNLKVTAESGTPFMGEVKLGHECVSIEETVEGVKAGVLDTDGSTQEVNCSFLVGTDGAASTVRRLMHVDMEGEHALQNLISIHFFSKQLAQYLSQNRPGMLYFVFNTKVIGVLVAHDLRAGEFVAQVPFFPPQQRYEDFTIEACNQIILALSGMNLHDVAIETIKQWVMHAEVAKQFVSSYERVILAGDAAHRFPPAGGFGMNTGIQDAHNLAWKLAVVLNGVAPRAFLCTYETERQSIAKANTALSMENFKAAMSIPSVLGLDPSNARFVHDLINKQIGPLLPRNMQRALLEGIFSLGRSQLSPLILNTNNPLGSIRLKRLRRILEQDQSLQLQFPAEDLGFRYTSGAIYEQGDASDKVKQHILLGKRNEFKPACKPGVRLPHSFIALLNRHLERVDKGIYSTLDLIKLEKLEFLMFVGPNSSGHLWDGNWCMGNKSDFTWAFSSGKKRNTDRPWKKKTSITCNIFGNSIHTSRYIFPFQGVENLAPWIQRSPLGRSFTGSHQFRRWTQAFITGCKHMQRSSCSHLNGQLSGAFAIAPRRSAQSWLEHSASGVDLTSREVGVMQGDRNNQSDLLFSRDTWEGATIFFTRNTDN